VATTPADPAEQRVLARIDPVSELVGLRLCQSSGLDSLVETILQRLLQRVGELGRLDTELRGSVVDHCLGLLAG
jgi:hypothetical protein